VRRSIPPLDEARRGAEFTSAERRGGPGGAAQHPPLDDALIILAVTFPRRLALPAIMLLGVAVRLPLWLISLRAPVDGDTAIVGLMALHRSTGPTFWGQPYGSPLDAWVALPFTELLGPTTLALRLPCLLLSLALIPLAFLLARELHRDAALPAAFLAACPPAYFVLFAALPPPLYGTTLVLLGTLMLGALRLPLASGWRAWTGGALWGAGAGLALWTHLMSAAVVLPCAVYLLWRSRNRSLVLLPALLALAATSAPWWLRLAHDPSAASVVSISEGDDPWAHARGLIPQMHRPLLALIGARCPITADDPQNQIDLRLLGQVLLVLMDLTVLAASAAYARAQPRAWLLLGCLLLPIAAFPFPLRAGPETVRFLSPAWLPLAVLSAWSAAVSDRPRRAWTVVLSIAVWQLLLTSQLLGAWRRPETVLVPDCRPALRLLEERGITRAWASYNTAYCLTYASAERVIASQPWNERFPGQPLPYLDEVRFATRAAWVLMPGADFNLPSDQGFADWVRANGGHARRTETGAGAVVFDDFAAPFTPEVSSLASAGPAGDADLATRALEPPSGAVTFPIDPPQTLGALTLVSGVAPPGLPAGLIVETSEDGRAFARVARLRESSTDLMWANGQPQGRDGAGFISIPLDGRPVAALRLTPAPPSGAWGLAEILLHPNAVAVPGLEAPQGSWSERRQALLASSRRDRVDWYWQLLLTSKKR
jgi:Dolichyl-phosphate-mannose-protein mannosyltransferase